MERRKKWEQVVRMRCQNISLNIPIPFYVAGNGAHTSKINKSFISTRIRRETQNRTPPVRNLSVLQINNVTVWRRQARNNLA